MLEDVVLIYLFAKILFLSESFIRFFYLNKPYFSSIVS
jgi:hypothetical protein